MGKGARAGLLAVLALGLTPPSATAREHDEAWVRQRVKQIKESDTTDFRKVPWTTLLEARRIAKEEGRPVFLFTLDGNLDTGRC